MTNLSTIEDDLYNFARESMVPDILHGWPHIERVLYYAEQINREVKGKWHIIKYAVLLHDIGYKQQRVKHNYISALLTEEFLKSKGIDEKVITHIKTCILTHSRQFSPGQPLSMEAQVVYDADGMDLFGPIGLMRALLSCGLQGKGFDCMIKKLQWRLDEKENFYSSIARQFVQDNLSTIEDYLNDLKRQLNQMKDSSIHLF